MTDKEKQVKHYLESYQRAVRKIEEVKETYARLYSTATGAQVYLNGGGGGTPGDIVGNSVAMMDEVVELIADKVEAAEAQKKHIMHLCCFIKHPKVRETIIRMYIDGKTKYQIAKDMDCSPNTVSTRKYAGIKTLAKYI